MYVNMDKITPEMSRQMINKSRERQLVFQKRSQLHMAVLRALEPFEGKKINVRIQRAVEAALPSCSVSYYKESLRYTLKIWGSGLSYDDRLDYQLDAGIKMTGIFTMNGFFVLNPHYHGFKKYVEDVDRFIVGFTWTYRSLEHVL